MTTASPHDGRRGIVVAQTSGFAEVRTADGVVRCRVRGRLKRGLATTDLVVVGDEVTLRDGPGEALLTDVAPRRTKIARLHPASARPVEDVLAANVDLVLVCLARGAPSLRPTVVDRYLAIAGLGGVPAVLVITKCDRPEDPTEASLVALYRGLGVPVVHTSVLPTPDLTALAPHLTRGLVAVVGPSGTGKSSLLNAWLGEARAEVGAVDEATGRGRHTTRQARLVPTPTGAEWVDTPGIRELTLPTRDPATIEALFPEIRARAPDCRFRDCRHDREPGCAVRAAIADGSVAASRLDSLHALVRGDDE